MQQKKKKKQALALKKTCFKQFYRYCSCIDIILKKVNFILPVSCNNENTMSLSSLQNLLYFQVYRKKKYKKTKENYH